MAWSSSCSHVWARASVTGAWRAGPNSTSARRMSAPISWNASVARRSPRSRCSCTGVFVTDFYSLIPRPVFAPRRSSSAKRIGGTNFQPASNIWMRGIWEEDYALPHRQVTWVVERSEDIPFTPPKDLRIEMIAPGKKLDVMLAEGEISAMLSPELPRLFIAGDKRIVHLFPNYKEIELAYFRKTGIFPIMHVTTIKQEIVEKFPWVPTNLTQAFEEAKQIAYRHIADPRTVPLAWVRTALEEQEAVLGRDPWAYGLTPVNRKNLETVLRYTYQQGMISNMLSLDALFAETDLGDAGGSDGI